VILRNRLMLARAAEQTDAFLDALDPGGLLGLRVLVDESRALNGATVFREHDYPAILEGLRSLGAPPGARNGVEPAALEQILSNGNGNHP